MPDRLPAGPAPAAPPTPAAHTDATSRRTVLRTAGLVALAGGGAATFGACAADAKPAAPASSAAASPSAAASSSAPASASATPTPAESASASASASPSVKPTGPSAAIADIPVGGGVILEDDDYVITQPSKGEFKAFSKICTHQGCPVTAISDGDIGCRCHGSKFSIEDGSVTNPPASKPLAESQVTVSGAEVYVTV